MNRTHLLDDDPLPAVRTGAFTPSGGSAASATVPQRDVSATRSNSAPASQGTDDLRYSVTDVSSHTFPTGLTHVHEDEEDDLPPVPPLITYCGYMRFACAFAKWPLLVAIVNLIAYSLCLNEGYFGDGDYFGYGSLAPVDSWLGGLLAGVWLGTAIWAYLCARRVERDVRAYDRVAQYEQGQQSEDPETATTSMSSIPNYEYIYGRVSRKIDLAFCPNNPRRTSSGYSEPATPPEGTTSLVNLLFCLWSIALAAGVLMMTGVLLGKGYAQQCDTINLSNSSKTFENDYSKLQSYSSTVQSWAIAPKGYQNHPVFYVDDDQGHGGQEIRYDFPTGKSTDIGTFAEFPDGTIFFSGFPPPVQRADEGNDYVRSERMILVESPGSGGASIYHKDIYNPLMFMPVENTITKNSKGSSVATQYCFGAQKSPSERNKEKRTWGYVKPTATIYCIIQNATSYEMRKEVIAWTDASQSRTLVTAASTGSEILFARVGADDRLIYEEIVSLTPSTMAKKGIYHFTRQQNRFNDGFYGFSSHHRDSGCIQDHVKSTSMVAAMIILGLCSAWLIVREGVPAGAAPVFLALVVLIRMCPFDRGFDGMCLVLGTFFFHSVLCCGNVCQLPAWIGRELYVWGLYSWILSFLVVYYVSVTDSTWMWLLALILFVLSGMILNHPVAKIVGFFMIAMGTFTMIQAPFRDMMIQAPFRGMYYRNYLLDGLVLLLIGSGILGLESKWTSNRGYCVALFRPLTRAGRALYYGSGNASRRRNA